MLGVGPPLSGVIEGVRVDQIQGPGVPPCGIDQCTDDRGCRQRQGLPGAPKGFHIFRIIPAQ